MASRNANQEDYVKRARQYYQEKNADKALYYFEKACLSCPCSKQARARRHAHEAECKERGLKPEPLKHSVDRLACSCRDLDKVLEVPPAVDKATKAGGAALTQLAMSPCTCGSGIQICDNAMHITALDGQAASFEAQDDFDRAFRTAMLIIRIAPGKPEGYLRAAKSCSKRRRVSDEGEEANPEEPTTFITAQLIYRHAMSNMTGHDPDDFKVDANPRSTKISRAQLVRRLLARTSKCDPVGYLPNEVVVMILQHLSVRSRALCLGVSRSWRDFMASSVAKPVWHDLNFQGLARPPSLKAFTKLVQISSQKGIDNRMAPSTRKVVLELTDKSPVAAMWKVLQQLPCLEHLELYWPPNLTNASTLPNPRGREGPGFTIGFTRPQPSVKTLVLHNCYNARSIGELLGSFTRLESLDFKGSVSPLLTASDYMGSDQLKFLRIYGAGPTDPQPVNTGFPVGLDLGELAQRIPTLEQLYLDNCRLARLRNKKAAFRSLQCLFVGPLVNAYLRQNEQDMFVQDFNNPAMHSIDVVDKCIPKLPGTLKVLDINTSYPTIGLDALGIAPRLAEEDAQPPLRSLEVFRFSSVMWEPADLTEALRPSLESGSLRSLVVNMPSDMADEAEFRPFVDDGLPLGSVTTVGMSGMMFRNLRNPNPETSRTAAPMADWVACFPNARTVHAFPQQFERCELLIERLATMETHKVERVYTNCLRGALRDEILKRHKGKVEIIETKDRFVPVVFPHVFEQEVSPQVLD